MRVRMRKQPEPIEKAKARARLILSKEFSRFALYFPTAKLGGVSIHSHRFELVMQEFPNAIIGVYDPSCPFRLIEDDIDSYYADYAAMVEARQAIARAKAITETPIFRSSGRRLKGA